MKTAWIFLLFSLSSEGGNLSRKDVERGLDLAMRMEYAAALNHFDSLDGHSPDGLGGRFFALTVRAARFYDVHDTSSLPEIFALGESILRQTEGRSTPLDRFYRAGTHGYLSIFLSQEGHWFKGALYGRRAVNAFEALAEAGFETGDARGVVGCYRYWSSVYLRDKARVPFIEGRREKGMEEAALGYGEAVYLKFALAHSLFWIYYKQKAFDKALRVSEEILLRYPRHRLFRKCRMDVLYKLRRFEESLPLCAELLGEYEGLEEFPVNYYLIRIKMALLKFAQGDREGGESLRRQLRAALAEGPLASRLKRPLRQLEEAR